MGKASVLAACVVALACLPMLAQETIDLDTALSFFGEGDVIRIAYSDAGRADLEGIVEAFRVALGASDDLDETNEDRVEELPVALELKDVINKLSQAYYTLANVFMGGESGEKTTYIKGKQWGFKSLRMNPDFVAVERSDGFVAAVNQETDLQALYWANSNWLRVAEFDVASAVRGQIPPKAKAIAERTMELAPEYMFYGSYRSLAAFWSGLPSNPLLTIFIGGMRQDYPLSLSYLCPLVDEPEICIENDGLIDPICVEYFENRTFLAEFYLMPLDFWEDAARILQSVLDEEIGDAYPLMNAYAQENAQTLLDEVNENL
jgi:hypothetical protein